MDTFHPLNKASHSWPVPLWAALGFGVIGCIWLGLSAATALSEPKVNPLPVTNTLSPTPSAFDITAAATLNLFGTAIAERPVDTATLPTTTLNLALSGIIAGVHPSTSRVLIAESGKPSKAYFKGDILADGAKLHSIDSSFVIIERGTHLEKLSLYRVDPTNTAPARHLSFTATETASATSPPEPLPSPEVVYKSLEERIAAIRKKDGS